MLKRRRFKQTLSLKDGLASESMRLPDEATRLPAGSMRDEVLKRARQADIALHLAQWLHSPGLQPPRR
jgi:hypothetical protein